jgi:hypothetical protein
MRSGYPKFVPGIGYVWNDMLELDLLSVQGQTIRILSPQPGIMSLNASAIAPTADSSDL